MVFLGPFPPVSRGLFYFYEVSIKASGCNANYAPVPPPAKIAFFRR